MKLIEIFDRLNNRHVSRIEFADGTVLESAEPLLIALADSEIMARGWIETSEEGLALHWNAETLRGGGLRAGIRPLGGIRSIV